MFATLLQLPLFYFLFLSATLVVACGTVFIETGIPFHQCHLPLVAKLLAVTVRFFLFLPATPIVATGTILTRTGKYFYLCHLALVAIFLGVPIRPDQRLRPL